MTGSKALARRARPLGLYDYRGIIASEAACLRFLRRARWPNGIRCPRCHGARIRRLRERSKLEYRCRHCDHHFSDISGTIFVKTRTPLSKWFLAIGLFRLGISANALMVELGVSYKVAWAMLDKLYRAGLHDIVAEQPRNPVGVDGGSNVDRQRQGGHGDAAGKQSMLSASAIGARGRNFVARWHRNHRTTPDFIWTMLEQLMKTPPLAAQSRGQSSDGVGRR